MVFLISQTPLAKWDCPIDLDSLWKQYERIIKDNGAIVLFGSGLFTAKLILSNEKLWKYNLVWKKGNRPTGFLNAKKQFLRLHEDIVVFYKKQPTYNPQFVKGEKNHAKGKASNNYKANDNTKNSCYGSYKQSATEMTDKKYPTSIIDVPKEHPQTYHPTQKPVALLEYLIKTFTNEGDMVLDNCMGSGSTGIACMNTNRNFIGIELDNKYFSVAEDRLKK